MRVVIFGRSGKRGDDILVGLAGGKLRLPIGEARTIGGPAEVMKVVVLDELRVVFLAIGDLFSDGKQRSATGGLWLLAISSATARED